MGTLILPEGLTKESCFNDLMERYPKSMKKFCEFIDIYKESIEWDRIFAVSGSIKDGKSFFRSAIKFHDLPYHMQLGIWIAYIQNNGGCHWECDLFELDLANDMVGYFETLEASESNN